FEWIVSVSAALLPATRPSMPSRVAVGAGPRDSTGSFSSRWHFAHATSPPAADGSLGKMPDGNAIAGTAANNAVARTSVFLMCMSAREGVAREGRAGRWLAQRKRLGNVDRTFRGPPLNPGHLLGSAACDRRLSLDGWKHHPKSSFTLSKKV